MDKGDIIIHSGISELQITGTTALITIENGKKNLITEPEFIETDLLRDILENNQQVTSLVITGAGRHFSHGADVSLFGPENNINQTDNKLEKAKKLLRYIEELPIVTAAAINGGCFGGGLEIAMSCQFRICSKGAVFGLPEVMHGVIPGMCGIERLTKLVGKSKAVSMVLSGEMISSSEAKDIGLVNSVSEDKNCLEDTIKYVSELTKGKTVMQIRSIISIINLAAGISINASEGAFGRHLKTLAEEKNH